jgi:two-component sensor histidine kinase
MMSDGDLPPATPQGETGSADRPYRFRARMVLLPLITFVILLIPTVLYWSHERSVQADFQQTRAVQYRLRLAKRIQTEIDSQLRPLRRLASEVATGDVRLRGEFANSARSICREEPTLRYIAWVDRSGHCIAAYPPNAAETVYKELFASTNPNPDQLFSGLSGFRDGMLLSFPTSTPTRAADRLIVLPIMGGMYPVTTSGTQPTDHVAHDMPSGAVVTCETTQAMLGAMIPPDASAPFVVEVKDERSQVLFTSDGATTPAAQALLRSQDVDQVPLLDQSWSMTVAAAPPGLGQRPASDTDAFLLCGLIIALLGGASVAQAGRHRRRERQQADEALQQQQRLNQQVRRDADAKAILLRELNHRVKNNLAGIVGLLSAGAPDLSDEAQQWLDRAIARIETLARAHELFIGTSSKLGLADLITKTLEPILAIKRAGVRITLDLQSVNDPLSTDQAITLAMVVNELVTNALQHGVGETGTVSIRSSRVKPDWAMIEVIDDGTGRGEREECAGAAAVAATVATFAARSTRTGIGLHLVRGLVGRELHGTFSLRENGDGRTVATVELPTGAKSAPLVN